MPRQVLTTISEAIARPALPRNEKPLVTSLACTSTQLMTLNVGSRIHIQATVESAVGTIPSESFDVVGGGNRNSFPCFDESQRDFGVKDFGTLIPGHGGMLDRLDGLCYAAPVFFHYVRYFYT